MEERITRTIPVLRTEAGSGFSVPVYQFTPIFHPRSAGYHTPESKPPKVPGGEPGKMGRAKAFVRLQNRPTTETTALL